MVTTVTIVMDIKGWKRSMTLIQMYYITTLLEKANTSFYTTLTNIPLSGYFLSYCTHVEAGPEIFWIFRPSEIVSDAIFRVKEQELLHACLALKTYTLAKL